MVRTTLRTTSPDTERGSDEGSGEHEGQWQTDRREDAPTGKALSDKPALKPYWGKPAVRNFREGNGNVGFIRSPLRATHCASQTSMPTLENPRIISCAKMWTATLLPSTSTRNTRSCVRWKPIGNIQAQRKLSWRSRYAR